MRLLRRILWTPGGLRLWLLAEAAILTAPGIRLCIMAVLAMFFSEPSLLLVALTLCFAGIPLTLLWACTIDVARRRPIRKALFYSGFALGIPATFLSLYLSPWLVWPAWALALHLLILNRPLIPARTG